MKKKSKKQNSWAHSFESICVLLAKKMLNKTGKKLGKSTKRKNHIKVQFNKTKISPVVWLCFLFRFFSLYSFYFSLSTTCNFCLKCMRDFFLFNSKNIKYLYCNMKNEKSNIHPLHVLITIPEWYIFTKEKISFSRKKVTESLQILIWLIYYFLFFCLVFFQLYLNLY